MAEYGACEHLTVLAAETEEGVLTSCRHVPFLRRKTIWIGIGIAAAAAGAFLYRAKWEQDRIEEQVRATLPFQI